MMDSDDLFAIFAFFFFQGLGVSGISYMPMSHTQIIAAVVGLGHFSYFRWQR